MPLYKDPQNKVHKLDDAAFSHLLPVGCVPISDVDAEALTAPTPAEVAAAQVAAAQAAKDTQDITAVKAYGKLTALKNMTPAQVETWVTNNVTNLAQAQDAITTLAIAVSVLARRL